MTKLLIATGDSFVLAIQKDAGYEATETLTGQGIRCIAGDPANEDILYAGSDSSGVWKSADGGRLCRRAFRRQEQAGRPGNGSTRDELTEVFATLHY